MRGTGRSSARRRSVFTIHNIGYQGVFSAGSAADVGPGVSIEAFHQGDLAQGRVNPMRHGILYADAVTTVSPTYAQEIRTPDGGHGLDADLRARSDAVLGILNGVDYEEWNPATDRYVPFRYDSGDLAGKARNKEALLDLLRMPAASSTPLLGMVTRLTQQKGIDLLFETLPELLQQREVRFVALGSGEPATSTSCTACRSASRAGPCSTAVTARSWRTSSRPRPTCS